MPWGGDNSSTLSTVPNRRGWAQVAVLSVGLVAVALQLPGPTAAIAMLFGGRAGKGVGGVADVAMLSLAAVSVWLLLGWVLLVVIAAAASPLPGVIGSVARTGLAVVAPVAVRNVLLTVVGASVVTGLAGCATVDTTSTSSTAGSADAAVAAPGAALQLRAERLIGIATLRISHQIAVEGSAVGHGRSAPSDGDPVGPSVDWPTSSGSAGSGSGSAAAAGSSTEGTPTAPAAPSSTSARPSSPATSGSRPSSAAASPTTTTPTATSYPPGTTATAPIVQPTVEPTAPSVEPTTSGTTSRTTTANPSTSARGPQPTAGWQPTPGSKSAASAAGTAAPSISVDWPGPASPSVDSATGAVVVLRGDSLWSIAARSLPGGADDAAIDRTWRAWYAANTSVIGSDPNYLLPGQILQPPTPGMGTP